MDTTLSSGGQFFDSEQVERARRYHRPVYFARVLGIAVGLAVLSLLSFTAAGDRLFELADWLPWWGEALAFSALVTLVGSLVATPLAFWRGYLHERAWGFSTQTVGGWASDRAKGVGIGVVLTALPMLGLIASVRLAPSWWPLVAAVGAALVVFVITFLAPVLLEPVFNKFAPLRDEALARELRELADRAEVPVRDVLVADASRRTRKHNAYVSGIGRTRRVVLWDTLLDRGEHGEIRLVVAHELGHRRFRHVALWTAMAMAGTAVFVLGLWVLLRSEGLLSAIGADGPGDPRVIPFVLLAGSLAELFVQPFALALSRRWERDSDRFSLDLTGDADAYEQTHRNLALSNLGDLDPPKAAYVFFFSHPTAPERLAAGRSWAAARTSA
jgi:Zn-dependent protease with chaperone function